jgi:hypothetical protein
MKNAALGFVLTVFIGVAAMVCSVSPAAAACTLPNPLTNGTTADGSQVIANFNSVISCIPPLTNPSFNGYIYVSNWSFGAMSGLGGERVWADYTCVPRCEGRINGTSSVGISFGTGGNPDRVYIDTSGNMTVVGSSTTCTLGNGTGATNCSSDLRLKRSIVKLDGNATLDRLSMINGVTFNWADPKKDQKQKIGVIAQDVLKAFPQLVTTTSMDFKGALGTYYSVDYAALTAPLISGVNALNGRTKQLEEEVKALKSANADQENQIGQLRADLVRLERRVSLRTAAR